MSTDIIDPTDLTHFWHQRLGYPTQPETLELHLPRYHSMVDDPDAVDGERNDFAKLWAKRIEALGGKWTKRPKQGSHRFVDLPATVDGVQLADELLKADSDSRTVVLFRGCMVWSKKYSTSFWWTDETLHAAGKDAESVLRSAAAYLAREVNGNRIAHVDKIPALEATAREAKAEEAAAAAERQRVERLRQAGPAAVAACHALVAGNIERARELAVAALKQVDTDT